VQSFGNIVASGIAGLLWTLVAPSVAFLYLAAWAAAATLVLVRLTSNRATTGSERGQQEA